MKPVSLWAETPDDPKTRDEVVSISEWTPRGPSRIASAWPDAVEQSRLFDLLGRINYKILQGECVYLRALGVTYKVLYGVYWRSVFSGAQVWALRCARIEGGMWAEGRGDEATSVDLPIRYARGNWVVEVQSFEFLFYGDVSAY